MKITIRQGLFETNSSSTHSCILTTRDIYDRWKSGELVYIDEWEWCDAPDGWDLPDAVEEGLYELKYIKKNGVSYDKLSNKDKEELKEFAWDVAAWSSRIGERGDDTDITFKTVKGVDIVAACSYGYSG